jgi:hypothetical protein
MPKYRKLASHTGPGAVDARGSESRIVVARRVWSFAERVRAA